MYMYMCIRTCNLPLIPFSACRKDLVLLKPLASLVYSVLTEPGDTGRLKLLASKRGDVVLVMVGVNDLSVRLSRDDRYDPAYYEISPNRNPTGPRHSNRRVARGGSWRHSVRFARCAARSSLSPEKQFSDFGFRCALTIEPL